MIDCRRTAERLASYVDDTLPAVDRAEVEQHLGACPPCRNAATREQGARTVLRECASRLRAEPLPPGLRSRCEAIASAAAAPRPGWWRGRLVPALITAVLIVFAGSAVFSFATHRSDTLLAAQLTADHVKCFHLSSPVLAGTAAQVESSLASRYGWNLHIPDSSAADGVELVGARRCLYADGAIPHVLYRVHGQDVSLYVLNGVSHAAAAVMALGHESRIWSRGNTTYVLVLPAQQPPAIASAAQYVISQVH